MEEATAPIFELTALERKVRDAAVSRDDALDGEHALRRTRGIVHTPPELARAVAAMVDTRLRAVGVGGMGDPRVTLIDPACGPGAFVAAAHALVDTPGRPRTVAIDIDPRALSQLRAALVETAEGADGVELIEADTLRDAALLERLSGLACPVILGNPPWATAAARRLEQPMRGLLEDYRRDSEGEPLAERKVGALSDTYVAFIRWASEVAARADGPAAVGLVTNSSFLEGPVHRGMRAALLRSFDGIDVVDLGGNAMLGRPAGGSRDDNVFGVRPGVAITVAWRAGAGAVRARLGYTRLRGTTAEKLRSLCAGNGAALPMTDLEARGTACRFVPTPRVDARYASWPSLAEVMPFHREGVQTNRDGVTVATERGTLLARLRAFAEGDDRGELAKAQRALGHYDPEAARRAVATALDGDPDGRLGQSVRPLAYRPFDDRFFCPVTPLCHRPRALLSAALERSAFALVTVRKDRGDVPWCHIGVVHGDVDSSYLSARSSCRTRGLPLRDAAGEDNMDGQFITRLSEWAGRALTVTDAAHYLLGVLCSPGYQRAFDGPLRRDYPRIPWPTSPQTLEAFVAGGTALERAAALPRSTTTAEMEPSPGLAALRIGHLKLLDVAERRFAVASVREGASARAHAFARARAWQRALESLPEFL